MVIGGLWHGASWNFAVWGLLHGCGLAMHPRRPGDARQSSTIYEMVVSSRAHVHHRAVCVFRLGLLPSATSFAVAVDVLKRIGSLTFSTANISAPIAMILLLGVPSHYAPKRVYEFTSDDL